MIIRLEPIESKDGINTISYEEIKELLDNLIKSGWKVKFEKEYNSEWRIYCYKEKKEK